MKKLSIFLFLLIGVSLSCSDDFTEVAPVGALNDLSLANEEGVELLLTAAYSTLDGIRNNQGAADWAASGDNWWFDVIADDAHKGSTDGDQADLYLLESFDWSTGNPYLPGPWLARFAGVNRANGVLAVIQGIEGGLPEKEAEARFLRAHYNFDLVKIYENVPFISVENFENNEFFQPNPGPIWDEIEADLQFAMANLPASQPEPGRPTRWTAQAFLGKAHIFQGEWADAFSNISNVVNSGPYSLLPDFQTNFRLAGDNSSESIFSIQFTADGGQSFNGHRGGTLNFPGGGPFGSCCGFYQPSQDLANAYQTSGGLPMIDTFNQSDIANDYGINSDEPFTKETGPLDPRIDMTIGRRGVDYNEWGLHPGKEWIRSSFADISGPYSPKKNIYFQGEDANRGTGAWGQQHSGINYHIMRYADLLLMGAEAAVEMGDLGTALAWTNAVRQRAMNSTQVDAGATNYDIALYPSFASQDEARQAVRFERRLELAMEGHRLFDLRRWGVAEQVMNEYFDNEARVITSFSDDPQGYEARHNLMPIPVSAIDASQGALTQNPGF